MVRLLTQFNKQERLWRLVTVSSALIGLICYALSSSFNHLFGNWKPWKIIFYALFSSFTFLVALLAKDWKKSRILRFLARKWQRLRILRFRSATTFLVMLSTTVFSFFSDRATAMVAKPDAYSVVSSIAFSTMSLSLSRNVPFVFEELMYFFVGIFIAQMMKIKLLLGFSVGTVISFCFLILHSHVDAHDPIERVGIQDQHPQVAIDVENHAITNTAAAPSTVATDEDEGSPFDITATKNASIDRLKQWRQAALALNASRRFAYTLDLKKEEEREQVTRKIRNHAQAIRNAYRFKVLVIDNCLRRRIEKIFEDGSKRAHLKRLLEESNGCSSKRNRMIFKFQEGSVTVTRSGEGVGTVTRNCPTLSDLIS